MPKTSRDDFLYQLGIDVNTADSQRNIDVLEAALRDVASQLNQDFKLSIDTSDMNKTIEQLSKMQIKVRAVYDEMQQISGLRINLGTSFGTNTSFKYDTVNIQAFRNAYDEIAAAQLQPTIPSSSKSYTEGRNSALENLKKQYDELGKLSKKVFSLDETTEEFRAYNSMLESAVQKVKEFERANLDVLTIGDMKSLEDSYNENLNTLKQIKEARNFDKEFKKELQNEKEYIKYLQKEEEITNKLNKKDDDTKVKSVQDLVKQYTTLQKKITQVQNSSGIHTEELGLLNTDLDNIINSLNDVGISVDKNTKQINQDIDTSKLKVNDLSTAYEQIGQSIQSANNAIKTSNAQDVDNRQNEELKKYIENVKRLNELKVELKRNKLANSDSATIRALEQEYEDLNRAVENTNTTIKQTPEALDATRKYSDKAARAISDLENGLNRTGISFGNFMTQLKTDMQLSFVYGLGNSITNSLIGAITSSISKIRDLDTAMTEIQMVTGDTDEATRSLMGTYSEMAKELGVTTETVSAGSVEWLRQGKTAQETSKLLKYSTQLATVGAIDSAEATELLTSTMNGYQLSVDEVGRAVDKLVAVDLAFATSSAEIATSLKYVASSANQAGLDLDQLIGLITVGSETTRLSAETLGNAWKTLVTRFQNVKLNKFVDDNGESLNNVESILAQFGIRLRDNANEWRDLGDVISEIGNKWNTFTSVEKSAIATQVAGTRQANIFIATMDNYDKVIKATNTSMEASGTTQEKYNDYLDSIDAKVNIFIATWEELVNNFETGSGIFGTVIDIGTKFVELLDTLINDTPLLTAALGLLAQKGFQSVINKATELFESLTNPSGVGGSRRADDWIKNVTGLLDTDLNASDGILSASSVLRNSRSEVAKAIILQKDYSDAVKDSALQLLGFSEAESKAAIAAKKSGKDIDMQSAALQDLGNKAKQAGKAILTSLGWMAVFTVIGAVIGQVEEYQQLQEEIRNSSSENLSTLEQQLDTIKSIRDEIASGDLSQEEVAEKEKELLEIEQELVDTYGERAKGIDLVNGSLDEQAKILNNISKEQSRMFISADKNSGGEYEDSAIGVYADTSANLSGIGNEEVQNILKNNGFTKIGGGTSNFNFVGTAEEIRNALLEVQNEIDAELQRAVNEGNTKLIKDLENTQQIITDKLSDYNITDEQKNNADQWMSAYIMSDPQKQQVVEQINANMVLFDNAVKSGNLTLAEQIKTDMVNIANSAAQQWDDGSQVGGAMANWITNLVRQNISDIDLNSIVESVKDTLKRGFEHGYSLDDMLSMDFDGSVLDDAIDKWIEMGGTEEEATKALQDYIDTLDNVETTSFSDLTTELKSVDDAYSALSAAQQEYNNIGGLTLDTVENLINNYPNYLQYLIDENGNINLNTEALRLLWEQRKKEIEAKVQEDTITQLLNYTKQQLDQTTTSSVEGIESETSALNDNAEAAAKAATAQAQWLYYNDPDTYAKLSAGEQAILDAGKRRLQAIENLQMSGTSAGGSASASSAAQDAVEAAEKAAEEQRKKWEEMVQAQFDDLEYKRDMDLISEKEYLDQLDALNQKYYKNKEEYLDEYRDYNVQVYEGLKQLEEDYLKERAESMIDSLDERIQALEDEKDALRDRNDEEERKLELQEAIDRYEAAKSQKVNRVYHEDTGWQWEVDSQEVNDAKKELENIQNEIALKEEEDRIDAQIEDLERAKDKWQEYADSIGEETETIGFYVDENGNIVRKGADDTEAAFGEMGGAVDEYDTKLQDSANKIQASVNNINASLSNVNIGNVGAGLVDQTAIAALDSLIGKMQALIAEVNSYRTTFENSGITTATQLQNMAMWVQNYQNQLVQLQIAAAESINNVKNTMVESDVLGYYQQLIDGIASSTIAAMEHMMVNYKDMVLNTGSESVAVLDEVGNKLTNLVSADVLMSIQKINEITTVISTSFQSINTSIDNYIQKCNLAVINSQYTFEQMSLAAQSFATSMQNVEMRVSSSLRNIQRTAEEAVHACEIAEGAAISAEESAQQAYQSALEAASSAESAEHYAERAERAADRAERAAERARNAGDDEGWASGIERGPVEFTGMAMLHGSKANPEWVLTNNQMQNFVRNMSRPNAVPDISNTENVNTNNNNNAIEFNNCVFPLNNVREPQDFGPALKQIARQGRR